MIEDFEIDRLRQKIDRIDHQLLALLGERAGVVLAVGDRKREQGLAVYDPEREEVLLERLAAEGQAPLDRLAVVATFRTIVQECRRLEDGHVSSPEPK